MNKKEFKMPKMGESITEGTIIEWRVNEGETFAEDDILLEVATDKVDNEVPAPFSGKMLEHKFKPDDVVPVGQTIALLEEGKLEDGRRKPEAGNQKPKTQSQKPKTETRAAQPITPNLKPQTSNRFISPLIDSIARKNHISYEELARISGTGKDGRLRKSDVSNYLENGRPFQFSQSAAEPSGFKIPDLKFDKGKGKIVEMDRMRQMIADHMVFSKHTSPHVTAYVEADLTEMVNWRNKNKDAFQKKYNQKLTFTPLFIECVAKAIKDFPMINSTLDGTNIIVKD